MSNLFEKKNKVIPGEKQDFINLRKKHSQIRGALTRTPETKTRAKNETLKNLVSLF